jgi:DNA-binding NtrC family response regulator
LVRGVLRVGDFLRKLCDVMELSINTSRELNAGVGQGESILIVDDSTDILDALEKGLTRLGYAITTCDSSREALKLVRDSKNAFQLVLSDTVMPGMNGASLGKEILKLFPTTPIILYSGYSNIISEHEVLEAGFAAYIRKPVKLKQLAETIRRILNKREN